MNYSIKSPAFTGLFIFLMVFTGCTYGTQKVSTKTVKQVNEHTLSVKQFSVLLARKLRNFDALAAKDANNIQRAKSEILREFLIQSLTQDWAVAQKIEITESQLTVELNKIRSSYPDDLSFRRSLAKENLSFSEWRDSLKYSLLEKEVFKKLQSRITTPTSEEIKNYYNEHKDQYRKKERVFLRHILVDEEAKADAIKSDLKTKDFAELAKKFSIAPDASSGGQIGWIEKGTVDYFDPLFTVGSGIQTIKSPFGYHIIRVEKKAPASISNLDEVKDSIIVALKAQREQAEYMAWLDAQLRSSKVLQDHELINSIKVDTRGLND